MTLVSKRLILLVLLALMAGNTALAKGNYHVEVVIFKHNGSAAGQNLEPIIDIPNFSATWPHRNVYLNSFASKISASPEYQLITHTSWGQKSASYNESGAKQFTENNISGFIKVFAKQLLIVDLNLNFQGHLLKERRRLKLDEIHYFDNAGFGVLMQVSRSGAPTS